MAAKNHNNFVVRYHPETQIGEVWFGNVTRTDNGLHHWQSLRLGTKCFSDDGTLITPESAVIAPAFVSRTELALRRVRLTHAIPYRIDYRGNNTPTAVEYVVQASDPIALRSGFMFVIEHTLLLAEGRCFRPVVLCAGGYKGHGPVFPAEGKDAYDNALKAGQALFAKEHRQFLAALKEGRI